MIIKNAIIEKVSLGFEDHGILSSFLTLDYGGTCQGFGGFSLGGDYTDHWIRGILEALELESWNDLVNTPIRVKLDSNGWNAKIIEIGHIIKDKWFNPIIEKAK